MPVTKRMSSLIEVSTADLILAEQVSVLPACRLPLAESVGRVLRQDVTTDRDQPPFDRVTMDGIALSSAAVAGGLRSFRRQGVQAAGQPPLSLVAPDACIEVMTGAVLPEGCDAVVRIEDVALDGEVAALASGVEVRGGMNVHSRGSDALQGRTVIRSGVRLTAAHIGIAAAMGRATLMVSAIPRVAICSTGDELVGIDDIPEAHQVRRSNAYALQAGLMASGYTGVTLHHLEDDRDAMLTALEPILGQNDVVILSGGVSMGAFDLVPDTLEALGATPHFHGVAQRPGKPLWFGTRSGTAIFALPGNPVSALTCLYRYVLPFLSRSSGTAPSPRRVQLASGVRGLPHLTRFAPVSLEVQSAGEVALEVTINTSGDFLSIGRSDGFVEIEAGSGHLPAGTILPFYSWQWV